MPRNYVRKTDRGTPLEELMMAVAEVKGGKSIRKVAKERMIDRSTLRRYLQKEEMKDEDEKTLTAGYQGTAEAKKIFREDMEKLLADHIRLFGLTSKKCRKLAFELAKMNNIPVPNNWTANGLAGRDWFESFKKRHQLACHTPKAVSLGRLTDAKEATIPVEEFFDDFANIMDRYSFAPHMIYALAKTEVQAPRQMIIGVGETQLGCLPSAADGERVTVLCAVSAVGVAVPPMLFPPGNITRAPKGTIAASSMSGCISEETFSVFLEHIAQHANCSSDHPMLLVLDSHEAALCLRAVETARTNGIVMLTVPTHTPSQLLPLDKSVFGPFRDSFNDALHVWMQSNPGRTMAIDPQCMNKAFKAAMTPQNIISGFKSAGLFPYNRDIFCEAGLESSVPLKQLKQKLQSDADMDPPASDTQTYSSCSSLNAEEGQPGFSDHDDNVILYTSLHPIMGQKKRKAVRRKTPIETPDEETIKEAHEEKKAENEDMEKQEEKTKSS